MGRGEVYIGSWWGNPKERIHWEDRNVDKGIILTGSSGSGMWGLGLDPSCSVQGQLTGSCECGNEPSVSMKYGMFLD